VSQINAHELADQTSNLAADLYSWTVLSRAKSMAEPLPAAINEPELRHVEAQAKEDLAKPFVKRALCAALKATTNNIREVAKVVCAVLLPLSLAGTITLTATPLAFAVVAVILFDGGVAAFCADQHQQDTKDTK
jgi:hypothetical protein